LIGVESGGGEASTTSDLYLPRGRVRGIASRHTAFTEEVEENLASIRWNGLETKARRWSELEEEAIVRVK
jgi:hypothetical protein